MNQTTSKISCSVLYCTVQEKNGRKKSLYVDDHQRLPSASGSSKGSISSNLNYDVPKTDAEAPRIDEEVILEGPQTEEEIKALQAKLRSGPSSNFTVLLLSGGFIVAIILTISAFLVFLLEEALAFKITASCFLGIAIIIFMVCAFLQRKNMLRYAHDLENDLFFCHLADNPIWKAMVITLEAALQDGYWIWNRRE